MKRTLLAITGGLPVRRTLVTVGAAAALVVPLFAFATPAYANDTRSHTCTEAGGTLLVVNPFTNDDRCVIATNNVITTSGTPTTTFGQPKPSGASTYVDSPATPNGNPVISNETRIGEPTTVITERLGTPTAVFNDRNSGQATSVPVTVAGTPSFTTSTELGTPISTDAPGTTNCRQVNDGASRQQVTKCDRTVVTTTVTPTEDVTTTTTPQTRITTTTQPRETVTTTTTPVTPILTTTRRVEDCTTTTQQTSFIRTETQPAASTSTTTTPQSETTFTTYRSFAFQGDSPTAQLAAVPETTVDGPPYFRTVEPLVVQNASVPAEPIITVRSRIGTPIVTGPVCTERAPSVSVLDGTTYDREVVTTAPTAPVITMQREELAPLVVVTRVPGASITEISTRLTGKSCVQNPAKGSRRTAC